MATRKTATRKTAAKSAPRVKIELPAGYEVIAGSFGQKWDFSAMPVLEGTITDKRTIEVKRGRKVEEAAVMEVETADGHKYTVWESAALRAFFTRAEKGNEVAIVYLGDKVIPGQKNPMHDFSAGIKPQGTKTTRR